MSGENTSPIHVGWWQPHSPNYPTVEGQWLFYILHWRKCRSKLHDESRLIQRSFDDNKGDDKKLKGQEHFMITKMMISRIKEWVQDWIKNTSRFKRKFDFKNQESSFKIQVPRIKIKIQDSIFKNQEKN